MKDQDYWREAVAVAAAISETGGSDNLLYKAADRYTKAHGGTTGTSLLRISKYLASLARRAKLLADEQ